MSRSYKHTPYWGDKKSKDMKRFANHRVRQLLKNPENSLSYNSYKKCFCSWNICEYYTIYPKGFYSYYFNELDSWHSGGRMVYPEIKQAKKEFKLHYLRK